MWAQRARFHRETRRYRNRCCVDRPGHRGAPVRGKGSWAQQAAVTRAGLFAISRRRPTARDDGIADVYVVFFSQVATIGGLEGLAMGLDVVPRPRTPQGRLSTASPGCFGIA